MNYEESVRRAFKDSKIAFTREELDRIEYADFGLNNIKQEGLSCQKNHFLCTIAVVINIDD